MSACSKLPAFESEELNISSTIKSEYSLSPGSSSFVGQVGGTLTPAVRKKRTGEMKVSNVPAGSAKRWVFILCNFLMSQVSKSSGEERSSSGGEEPNPVQSRIPFWHITPARRWG